MAALSLTSDADDNYAHALRAAQQLERPRRLGLTNIDIFVRTVLRERRVQKLRERLDEVLLASRKTPAEDVTPEYLASLRQEAKALINRKEASGRKSHKEV